MIVACPFGFCILRNRLGSIAELIINNLYEKGAKPAVCTKPPPDPSGLAKSQLDSATE